MYHAATRLGLGWSKKRKRPSRKARRYPKLSKPGEKVHIDVKEVPYNCLKGAAKRDRKHLYQWTAIDECTGFSLYMAMQCQQLKELQQNAQKVSEIFDEKAY